VTERYQRAADLLEELLATDRTPPRRTTDRSGVTPAPVQAFPAGPKPRETPKPRFCLHCNKLLPARHQDRCPFCAQAQ
jgi:hypothetical protein